MDTNETINPVDNNNNNSVSDSNNNLASKCKYELFCKN